MYLCITIKCAITHLIDLKTYKFYTNLLDYFCMLIQFQLSVKCYGELWCRLKSCNGDFYKFITNEGFLTYFIPKLLQIREQYSSCECNNTGLTLYSRVPKIRKKTKFGLEIVRILGFYRFQGIKQIFE